MDMLLSLNSLYCHEFTFYVDLTHWIGDTNYL